MEAEARRQQLMRSSSSSSKAAPGARAPTWRRARSSSTDRLDVETPADGAAFLSRSYSAAAAVDSRQTARPATTNNKQPGAAARLARKLKEHRARFYIVRRCVSMLVCWRDADD